MKGFFNSIITQQEKNLFLKIGGQSNALGTNTGAPSEAYLLDVIPKTFIWTGSEFEPLQYNVNNFGQPAHGIELNFGWLASQNYDAIYIVKDAVSATALGDDPNTDVDWDKATGTLYAPMVVKVNNALTNLRENNIRIRKYISYWNQGERDANVSVLANAYQANLEAFIANERADFINGEKFKFIATRLSINITRAFLALVRTSQENAISNTSNSDIINQDDLLFTDGVHFTSEAQNTLAQRTFNLI